MTAVIIISVLLFLLFLILILPVMLDLSFDGELRLAVKYAGITVFNTQKQKKPKKHREKQQKEDSGNTKSKKKDSFLKKKYKELGLSGAAKYFSEIIKLLFDSVGKLLKKLKFDRFYLELDVASDNAADTAVEYGAVCSAVYPVAALLESTLNFDFKYIAVRADFEHTSSELKISFRVTTRVIYAVIIAAAAFFKYLKIKKESEKNE